ncbi:MAG: hypothetical protein IMZ41_00460, partial [Actinobacteria bacterium]|nr:hypothetical protein [Actinomycetota bacterium]
MFYSDKPIDSYREDLLNRSFFSKNFAKTILSYKDKDSIAIGLHGEWGSGKTSVVNMILEEMEVLGKELNETEKPIILKFNPWNFTEQNQLISQFFKQLSFVLKIKDSSENAKKISENLELYASLFDPLISIPIPLIGANNILKFPVALMRFFSKKKLLESQKKSDLNYIKKELSDLIFKQNKKII